MFKLPEQAKKEKYVLRVMHPKWATYQNIFARIVKGIYAKSINVMTDINIMQSQLLKILINVKEFFGCSF